MILWMIAVECYFVFLHGLARGTDHTWRDQKDNSRWALWFKGGSGAEDWHMTGAAAYYYGFGEWNQSWPWTCDFEHLVFHARVIFFAMVAWTAGMWHAPIWYIWVRPVLLWWIEGRGFTLFYHVVLPVRPRTGVDYSLGQWFKGWLWPVIR